MEVDLGIENLPDAEPEIELAVKSMFLELLRICPLEPEPRLRVKESEHASCYGAKNDTIYICVPQDSELPTVEEFREILPQPHSWSGMVSEIVEEFIHAYQGRLGNTESSADAHRVSGQYGRSFEGEGHDARFFEATLRFARCAGVQEQAIIGAMVGRIASDYGG